MNQNVNGREQQLLNVEYAEEIMVGDDPALLAELKAFYVAKGMSEADVALAIDSTRLRKRVITEKEDELDRRIDENPRPTEVELAMGIYVEHLEPQVREAVLLLRRKGYATICSGFEFFCRQSLIMSAPDLKDLDPQIREQLASLGADATADSVSFKAGTDMAEIKALWDRIAEILPDLGRPAPAREAYNLDFARLAKQYASHVYQRYVKYL